MCGIVGVSGKFDIDVLRKMNSLLIHRDPDGGGEFVDRDQDFGFAMRRLSIIDLEKGIGTTQGIGGESCSFKYHRF